MSFTSNADRFRGPELPHEIKRSILCLGDSFTMGYGVNDGEEFVARLAKRVPAGWTVVNAGIGGMGNGRWLHVLERERERLRPRIVLLQICGNDFADNLEERLYSLTPEGQLNAHDPYPVSLGRRLRAIVDEVPLLPSSHLVGLGRQFFVNRRAGPEATTPAEPGAEPGVEHGRPLLHALMRRMVGDVRAVGAIPLVLMCAVTPPELAALEHLFGELQVRVLITPSKEDRPDHYFKVDGHWNSAGHAAAAEQIWAELQHEAYRLAHD